MSDVAKPTTRIAASPILSRRWLTILLTAMCTVPIITISVLWIVLPPVYEQELEASVRLEGIPRKEFYDQKLRDRPKTGGGLMVVKNEGEKEWTNIIIRINRSYMAYEKDFPLAPGEERVFELDRFQTRTSNRLNLRYYPIRNIEVYARLPSGARATYEVDY